MNTNFQNFFNNSTLDIKLNLCNIFENNEKFDNYFRLSYWWKIIFGKSKIKKKKLAIQKYKEKKEVYDLLNDKNTIFLENILKYAYSSQRGNNLLLITFFAQKKLKKKDLWKNYQREELQWPLGYKFLEK